MDHKRVLQALGRPPKSATLNCYIDIYATSLSILSN